MTMVSTISMFDVCEGDEKISSIGTPYSLSIVTKLACYTASRWDLSSERKL